MLRSIFDGKIVGILIGAVLGVDPTHPHEILPIIDGTLKNELEIRVNNRVRMSLSVGLWDISRNAGVHILYQQHVPDIGCGETDDWNVRRKRSWGLVSVGHGQSCLGWILRGEPDTIIQGGYLSINPIKLLILPFLPRPPVSPKAHPVHGLSIIFSFFGYDGRWRVDPCQLPPHGCPSFRGGDPPP